MARIKGCYECGNQEHWKINFQWDNKVFVKGCGQIMKLLWRKQHHNKGFHFMKCKGNPWCQGCLWMSQTQVRRLSINLKWQWRTYEGYCSIRYPYDYRRIYAWYKIDDEKTEILIPNCNRIIKATKDFPYQHTMIHHQTLHITSPHQTNKWGAGMVHNYYI